MSVPLFLSIKIFVPYQKGKKKKKKRKKEKKKEGKVQLKNCCFKYIVK
jgi:hypothetical protein